MAVVIDSEVAWMDGWMEGRRSYWLYWDADGGVASYRVGVGVGWLADM